MLERKITYLPSFIEATIGIYAIGRNFDLPASIFTRLNTFYLHPKIHIIRESGH